MNAHFKCRVHFRSHTKQKFGDSCVFSRLFLLPHTQSIHRTRMERERRKKRIRFLCIIFFALPNQFVLSVNVQIGTGGRLKCVDRNKEKIGLEIFFINGLDCSVSCLFGMVSPRIFLSFRFAQNMQPSFFMLHTEFSAFFSLILLLIYVFFSFGCGKEPLMREVHEIGHQSQKKRVKKIIHFDDRNVRLLCKTDRNGTHFFQHP